MENAAKPKHWFWGNWIILSAMSVLSFSICNWFIAGLTEMGAKSIYYFCSGSLVFAIVYFLVKREWKILNTDE